MGVGIHHRHHHRHCTSNQRKILSTIQKLEKKNPNVRINAGRVRPLSSKNKATRGKGL